MEIAHTMKSLLKRFWCLFPCGIKYSKPSFNHASMGRPSYTMSGGIVRRCVVLLADEEQVDDYSDFKAEIEEVSNGIVEIDDLEDISSAVGENKLARFLQLRDVVIIICSEKMKDCIEYTRNLSLDFDGTPVSLNGYTLNQALRHDAIRSKVILVSWNSDDKVLPKLLDDVPHQIHGNSISKHFINQVICTIRGIPGQP